MIDGDCPARQWSGCKGQGTITPSEEKEWLDFYERSREGEL